jgi:hypothetical protein
MVCRTSGIRNLVGDDVAMGAAGGCMRRGKNCNHVIKCDVHQIWCEHEFILK